MLVATILKAILKFCTSTKFFLVKKCFQLEDLSQIHYLSAFKHILDLISKCAGADQTEQKKFFQTFPNYSNLAFCNSMSSKWLFFWNNCPAAGALPPSPHSGNLFSRTHSSQPTTFKIVIAGFLNEQITTIIMKPCLTIIVCIFINGCNKLITVGYWLLFEWLNPPLKISGAPLY